MLISNQLLKLTIKDVFNKPCPMNRKTNPKLKD